MVTSFVSNSSSLGEIGKGVGSPFGHFWSLVTSGHLGDVASIYSSCYKNINTFYVNDGVEEFGKHNLRHSPHI